MPLVGVFLVSVGVRSTSRVSDETSWVNDLPVRWRGGLGRGPVRWDEARQPVYPEARNGKPCTPITCEFPTEFSTMLCPSDVRGEA